MRKVPIIISFILVFVCLPQPTLQAASAGHGSVQAGEALQAWLKRDFDPYPELMVAVIRFYEARQFKPGWMGFDGLTPQGETLLKTLVNACDERTPKLAAYLGHLLSIVVNGSRVLSRDGTMPLEALVQSELGMTQLALYFATLFDAEFLAPEGPARLPQQQIAVKLAEALAGPGWGALRHATYPRNKPFHALQRILEHYRNIKLSGGWPNIPDGPQLKFGSEDPRVPLLRIRLITSGDLASKWLSTDESFDNALVDGVRNFQRRHGLKTDGVVGPDTLTELNTTVQERITQIKLNMIRWRSLPDPLGTRYLLVNIPGFKLNVVEDNHVVHSMKAIVGKKNRRTPVMSAMMTYLEINPYWNIPHKIARKDILPLIQNDPSYLLRKDIQVFSSWEEGASVLDPLTIDWQRYSAATFPPFRLTQRPTVSNALGRIKFIFPNRFSVYIHDTPAKSLFDKNKRTFSAGCVRIEKPLTLAKYLLDGQSWNDERINAKIRSRQRKVVVLKAPVPVHLVYMTAWVDENGTVYFFKDIYGRDKSLRAQLKRFNPEPPAFMADLMNIDQMLEEDNNRTAAKPSEQSTGNNTS